MVLLIGWLVDFVLPFHNSNKQTNNGATKNAQLCCPCTHDVNDGSNACRRHIAPLFGCTCCCSLATTHPAVVAVVAVLAVFVILVVCFFHLVA